MSADKITVDIKVDEQKLLKKTFDNVETVSNNITEEIKKLVETNKESGLETVPSITSLEWTDFILKQFDEDELIDGNPTLDGLRRICNKYLGTVLKSITTIIVPPSIETGFENATVQHKIVILWTKDVEDPIKKTFVEVADVNWNNTDPEYRRFASSTASSRAEGRCYRKMLCLRRVVTAEEVTEVAVPGGEDGPTNINLSQKTFIKSIANRIGVSVKKFVNMGQLKVKNINEIPYNVAQKMIGQLTSYQRNNNAPEHIKLGPDEKNNDKDFS